MCCIFNLYFTICIIKYKNKKSTLIGHKLINDTKNDLIKINSPESNYSQNVISNK